MAIIVRTDDERQRVDQAWEILRQRLAPAVLGQTGNNGTHLFLWLAEQVSELPADAQTLADCLYRAICKHLGEDKLDWLVEPKAMAKFRKGQGRPLDVGRNVREENNVETERDREHAEKQRILAAQKANASGYASARRVCELFILEGRLGETIEYRNELLRYIAKQEMAGKPGQDVYKQVERLADERYQAHRRRLEASR